MPTLSRSSALAAAGAGLLALGLSACSGSAVPADTAASGFAVDEHTLVFGVVPDSVDTQTNYGPLMDYIAQETGMEVEFHESTDYAAMIEASLAGKIDLASFSGFTYVAATNNGAEITPISSIITEPGQEPGYYSQAIVPAGSDIETIADMAGQKICFVDPSSTSGYLFPSASLIEADLDPTTDITPVFAGKHDVSVQKVAAGVECDAGFAEDSAVTAGEGIEVIDETMVPGAPITVADSLPEGLKSQLTDLLDELSVDQIIDAGITSADSEGFRSVFEATTPVDDAYFDGIRELCETTGATQCQV